MNTLDPRISLVIPTYNERDNIENTLRNVTSVLDGEDYEIIVVDDDSPDRTWEIVENLCAEMPRIRLIRRTAMTRDLARSTLEGFRAARGVILGDMDADGSHQPAAIPTLLKAIENGCDLAVGSRYMTGGVIVGWPVRRLLLSRAGTKAVQKILQIGLSDPLSGFYFVRREIFERMSEITAPRGFKLLPQLCVIGRPNQIAEVPIVFHNRSRGSSKMSGSVIFHTFAAMVRLITLKTRATNGSRHNGHSNGAQNGDRPSSRSQRNSQ